MKTLLLCLLLFPASLFAQSLLQGLISDSASQQPIPNATVFLSNTSHGTITDKNGQFTLTQINPGGYDLIVSCIGYTTYILHLQVSNATQALHISMVQKSKELKAIYITPGDKNGWTQWGKLFLECFIGTSINAEECSIKNTNALRFHYSKSQKLLQVYANEPLIIENSRLGYLIHYQMEEFYYDFNDRLTTYEGFPYFEILKDARKHTQKKWKRNRLEAFNGSMQHFIRALYNRQLIEQGFEIRRLVRIPNLEQERVRALPNNSMLQGDSTEYYHSILQQKPYTEVYGKTLLTADSLLVLINDQPCLYFTNLLYIIYKKGKEAPEYLRSFNEFRQPYYQRSIARCISEQPLQLGSDGSFDPPLGLFTEGYWGWEKMADTLPFDYEPAE